MTACILDLKLLISGKMMPTIEL